MVFQQHFRLTELSQISRKKREHPNHLTIKADQVISY
jgi:hypothetical protein